MTEQQQPEFTIDFDPAEIRAKYQAELARRAPGPRRAADRSTDRLAPGAAGADLWSAPISREPQEADVELLIIGGGFAGLLTAVRAQEAGVESIKIVEAAGDFGGVWYWNRYPNAQCDTEGYLYFPLLEETGYMPTRRFPFASEIFEHAQRIGRHFGLYAHTLFQTEAERLEWSDTDRHWTLTTNRGDRIRARFVMYSRGAFGVPRTPDVPGLAEFPGEVFHASRWNYDYTGGAPGIVPDQLKDKRVAVVGSAATGVQVVSALAPVTGQLYVIQRTPTALLGDRDPAATDADWYRALPAGWQRERRRSFDGSTSGLIPDVDLVDDTWSTTFRAAMTAERVLGDRTLADLEPEQAQLALELADMEVMERARTYTRTQVTDPDVAAKLEPWYGMRCKRITFDDGYLASFNRDNVTLIDAPGTGLERIEGNRLIAGGEAFDVDCIIFATGFDTSQDVASRAGLEIVGRGGKTLQQHNAAGLRSLHGVMTDDFPNLFATGQGQNAFAVNYTSALAVQADHIAALITAARERGAHVIEPTPEAVDGWVATIDEVSTPFREYQQFCVPSYFNADGNLSQQGALATIVYTPGVLAFEHLMRDWREAGFAGLQFVSSESAELELEPSSESVLEPDTAVKPVSVEV